MLTIITETDCIMLNCKTHEREQYLKRMLEYHKKNETGKKVRLTYDNDKQERRMLNTTEVIEVTFEPRAYSETVGNAIDELLKTLD